MGNNLAEHVRKLQLKDKREEKEAEGCVDKYSYQKKEDSSTRMLSELDNGTDDMVQTVVSTDDGACRSERECSGGCISGTRGSINESLSLDF